MAVFDLCEYYKGSWNMRKSVGRFYISNDKLERGNPLGDLAVVFMQAVENIVKDQSDSTKDAPVIVGINDNWGKDAEEMGMAFLKQFAEKAKVGINRYYIYDRDFNPTDPQKTIWAQVISPAQKIQHRLFDAPKVGPWCDENDRCAQAEYMEIPERKFPGVDILINHEVAPKESKIATLHFQRGRFFSQANIKLPSSFEKLEDYEIFKNDLRIFGFHRK